MNYKKGYKIKPLRVNGDVIVFTDGVNEVNPSQKACIDYGYSWDKSSNTCRIVKKSNSTLIDKVNQTSNTVGGKKNRVAGDVQNSVIYGQRNTFEGNNQNVLVLGDGNRVQSGVFNSAIVSGNDNIVTDDVNNSSILSGVGAIAIRDNETIVGGFYNDGSNNHVASVPYTVQSSKFVMHGLVDTIGVSTFLELGEINYIPVHPNSRVHLKASFLYLGDGVNEFNSKEFKADIDVNADGEANILKFDNGTTMNNLLFSESNSIGIQTDSDGLLQVSATGQINAKRIVVADLTLTEVIYR